MIYTKRIISIILSFCLFFSCISFSFASDIIDVDQSSEISDAIIGSFSMQGYTTTGNTLTTFVSTSQYLPAMGSTPVGFKVDKYYNPSMRIENISGWHGYYSVYLCLIFYSTGSNSDIINSQCEQFKYFHLEGVTPKINYSSTYNNSYVPVGNSYYYIKTVWLKWDIGHLEGLNVALTSTYTGSYIDLVKTSTPDEYWKCYIANFSVVKYPDETTYNDSDNIESIAQNIISIKDDLALYLPQIVNYLGSMNYRDSLIFDEIDEFHDDFLDYVSQDQTNFTTLLNFLSQAIGSGSTDSGSLYRLFYYFQKSWTYSGRDTTTSPYYYLFYIQNPIPFFDYDITDPNDTGAVYNLNLRGFIQHIKNLLMSIDNLLIFDYAQKQNTINSAEYQAGQAVSDNISSNGGFGALSNFSYSASGFGNISLIGNIFNGLGSAFRWFSTQTKNNLDNVPTSRRHNDIVTNYYQSGLEEAESYLYATTESNTESSD